MQRISILSFKGGTGKTTFAQNIAHALGLEGKEVLLVDACGQGDAGKMLTQVDPPTLSDVLMEKATFNEAIRPAREHVDIIPADLRLSEANNHIMLQGPPAYEILREATDPASLPKPYDFILYDHAPSKSNVTHAVLMATDSLIIPCMLEPFAIDGMLDMINDVTAYIKRMKLHIDLLGIVPFRLDVRYKVSKPFLEALIKNYGEETVLHAVRTDAAIVQAQMYHQTVFEYDKHSHAASDFTQLARSLIGEGVTV